MEDRFVTVVKGISGSGKSTRIFALFNFLKDYGFGVDDFKFNDKKVGYHIHEINTLLLGKTIRKDDKVKFQGFDQVNSSFDKVANFSEFMKASDFNFIIEGAGITDSNRFRPQFLSEIGFNYIFVQYYSFKSEQKQQYLDRIIGRSGKPPRTEVMYNKIKNFERDHEKSKKEMYDCEEATCSVHYDLYNVSVENFGLRFLMFMGLDDLLDDYVKYCKECVQL